MFFSWGRPFGETPDLAGHGRGCLGSRAYRGRAAQTLGPAGGPQTTGPRLGSPGAGFVNARQTAHIGRWRPGTAGFGAWQDRRHQRGFAGGELARRFGEGVAGP